MTSNCCQYRLSKVRVGRFKHSTESQDLQSKKLEAIPHHSLVKAEHLLVGSCT